MRKDIPKLRTEKLLTPRNGTRQEGSITKLKMRADKKREPKEDES